MRAPDQLPESVEELELEVDDEESSILDPFDPEEIDIVSRTPNVNLLLSRLRTGRLDLEPDFQRKVGVWNDQRKSRLIESLLLRIPVPTMYAAESRTNADNWTVVDGVQRISTIASFIEPNILPGAHFTVLRGLEYLKEYEGKTYADLGAVLQTRIQETEFVLNLIRRGTPEPVMFNIFARINTGGAPLTRQELRHALTPGEGRRLLKRLADSEGFSRATGGGVRTDRMEDREMILRFASFYIRGVGEYTSQTEFDRFLTDTMKLINQLSAAQIRRIESNFGSAMIAAEKIFGGHAFRKSLPGDDRRAPINKALFETVASSLAMQNRVQRSAAVKNRDEIVRRFRKLLRDDVFVSSISQGTGDFTKVRLRHSKVDRALTW